MPGFLDLSDPLRTHAQHLVQSIRLLVDDLQGVRAELAHDALGRHRPDPLDQPTAQVFLDARGGGGQHGCVALDLELAAMLSVHGPVPLQPHVLADADPQHVPDGSDFVVLAVGNQFGDGVAGLFVVEGQALDDAFKSLHGWPAAHDTIWPRSCPYFFCQRGRKVRVSPEAVNSQNSDTWLPPESTT